MLAETECSKVCQKGEMDQDSVLLVVGNDRIGRSLLHKLGDTRNIVVAVDRSGSVARLLKLITRGSLTISDVLRMAWAEFRRPDFPLAVQPEHSVTSNADLIQLINEVSPARVYLFRAGLIIGKKVLSQPVEILNFHAASIETHGGLASIRRALEDGAYDQVATLHRVTARIDEGEVLAEKPYRLDRRQSYFWNEQTAYETCVDLALEMLGDDR